MSVVVPRRCEMFVQSSQESSLTEVTSIGVRDDPMFVLEESDELLHLLLAKREELLREFRALDRCLIKEKEEKV